MMNGWWAALEAYSRYSSYKDGLRIKRSGPCTGFTVRTSGKINLLDETVNEVGGFLFGSFFLFGVGGAGVLGGSKSWGFDSAEGPVGALGLSYILHVQNVVWLK